MTLTALEPTAALVVIDLQKGLLGAPTATPVPEIVARTVDLAEAFRAAGLPVVLVNVTGRAPGRTDAPPRAGGEWPADFAEIVDELGPRPGDHLVTKQTWGAFHGTDLHDYLQSRGVTQLVLTGVSTSAGVETTARAAYEHGYHVVLAVDAMTDAEPQVHANSVERIFPKLGEVTTSAEVLRVLAAS
ncbi:isochorismatase family protein [Jatrophihabitans sp.]|uniref:isochorismatase family protein n=1 Tax=Jatrophihabitans sp. TaxID=1932789 RepID=UPI0030C704A0|nr:isochorismatase family protein [Jatrophihabitans sp.]